MTRLDTEILASLATGASFISKTGECEWGSEGTSAGEILP